MAPDEVFESIRSPHHGHVKAVRMAMRQLRFDNVLASKPSRERDLDVRNDELLSGAQEYNVLPSDAPLKEGPFQTEMLYVHGFRA